MNFESLVALTHEHVCVCDRKCPPAVVAESDACNQTLRSSLVIFRKVVEPCNAYLHPRSAVVELSSGFEMRSCLEAPAMYT